MNDNKGAGSHLDNSLNPNQNAASRTKDSTVPCVQTAPQVSAMLTTEVKPGVQDNTDPSPSSTPKITTIHRSSSRSGKHPYEGSGGRKASSSVRDGLITGLTPTQRPSRAKKGLRVHNCTHPGCEKIFTRAEHLRRHQLNHNSDVVFKCNVCGKRFVREDLLNRHQERHAITTTGTPLNPEQDLGLGHVPLQMTSPTYSENSSYAGSSGDASHIYDASIGLGLTFPTAPAYNFPQSTAAQIPTLLSTSLPAITTASYHFPNQQPFYRLSGPASVGSLSRTPTPSQPISSTSEPYRSQNIQPYERVSDEGTYRPPGYGNQYVDQNYALLLEEAPKKLLPAEELTLAAESNLRDIALSYGANFEQINSPQTEERLASRSLVQMDDYQCMDDYARSRILYFLDPNGTSQFYGTITLEILQQQLRNYWDIFHLAYPLLHKPTFTPSTHCIYVLSMVIALGSSLASAEVHAFGVALYERVKTFCRTSEFEAAFPHNLYLQQTLFLTDLYCKLCTADETFDSSDHFDVKLSKHLRQCEILSVTTATYAQRLRAMQQSGTSWDLGQEWLSWTVVEAKRRLALAFILWDVEQAVLFRRDLCSTAQQLQVPVHSKEDEYLWACSSPFEWYNGVQNIQPQPLFIELLRDCLNPTRAFPDIDHVGSYLILHGLISVEVDLCRIMGIPGSFTDDSKAKLSRLIRAFDRWRLHIERLPMEERKCNSRAMALYFAGRIYQMVNFDSLRLLAGDARMISSRTVALDYYSEKSAMYAWAVSMSGKTSVFYAVEFLAYIIHEPESIKDNPFIGWCSYMAALVCWAYEDFSSSRPQSFPGGKEIWIAEQEANNYLQSMRNHSIDNLPLGGTTSSTGLLVHVNNLMAGSKWGMQLYSTKVLSQIAIDRGFYI